MRNLQLLLSVVRSSHGRRCCWPQFIIDQRSATRCIGVCSITESVTRSALRLMSNYLSKITTANMKQQTPPSSLGTAQHQTDAILTLHRMIAC